MVTYSVVMLVYFSNSGTSVFSGFSLQMLFRVAFELCLASKCFLILLNFFRNTEVTLTCEKLLCILWTDLAAP